MEEEATCPICFEYLTDPVTLDCGHNFCQACVTSYCETWEELGVLECPICKAPFKKGHWRTNWQLANIVEKIKHLPLKEDLCRRHKEKFTRFCKEDEELLCSMCEQSLEHSQHNLLPLEEAAQEFKDQISSFLVILRKGREQIQAYARDTGAEQKDLLKLIRTEKQKMVAQFRQLQEFLEDQENLLLAQMEEVEKEIARKKEVHMIRLSKELSSLESIIPEMEEKCRQSETKLLQDIRSSLQRYENMTKFENPVAFPPALKWRIWDCCDINPFLEGVMNHFRDTLGTGLQLQKANVTLDPDTACTWLLLSNDHKSVRMGYGSRDVPDNPERFDRSAYILGREGFTAGRHFWEVTLGNEEEWAVGVADNSMQRKGKLFLNEQESIWAVGKWKGTFVAVKPSGNVHLSLGTKLKKVRVILNCAGRRVCFYDAGTATQILAHSVPSISKGTLHPFFYVNSSACLTISP